MASKSDTPQATPTAIFHYHEPSGQKAFDWLNPKAVAIRRATKRARMRKKKAAARSALRQEADAEGRRRHT